MAERHAQHQFGEPSARHFAILVSSSKARTHTRALSAKKNQPVGKLTLTSVAALEVAQSFFVFNNAFVQLAQTIEIRNLSLSLGSVNG